MKYLVTGSAGFIGGNLKKTLLLDGHEVVDFDLKDQSGDIRNPEQIMEKAEDVDGIYHLAAIASVQESITDPEGTYETNVAGTRNVFEAARAYDHPIVYASSAAIYGDNQNLPLSEAETPRPLSPYAEHKLQNEKDAAAMNIRSFGLRFFNIYGPGQDPSSPYSGVISIFHNRLESAKQLTIFGDGNQTRDFVAVADAVAALRSGMEHVSPDAPFANVCTNRTTTLLELARTLGEILDITPDIRFEETREGDIRHSCGTPEKLQTLTGFKPEISLHDGLSVLIKA